MCKRTGNTKAEISRREFLAQSSQAAFGIAMLPTLLGIERGAIAADLPNCLNVTIHFPAGVRLAPHAPQMAADGSPLSIAGYAATGFDTNLLTASGGTSRDYGSLMAMIGGPSVGGVAVPAGQTVTSQGVTYAAGTVMRCLLKQMKDASLPISGTSSGATELVSYAAVSNDDDNNEGDNCQVHSLHMNQLAARAHKYVSTGGRAGSNLSTVTGYAPEAVSSVAAVQALLGPVGPLALLKNATQRGAVAKFAQALSSRYAANLASSGMRAGTTLASNSNNGYSNATTAFGSNSPPPSPFDYAQTKAIWQTVPGFGLATPTSAASIAASMMMLAHMGLTSSVSIVPNIQSDQHAESNLKGYADLTATWETTVIPMLRFAVANGMGIAIHLRNNGTASIGRPIDVAIAQAPNANEGADNAGRAKQVSIFYMPNRGRIASKFQINGHDNTGNVLLNAASSSALGQAQGRTAVAALIAANTLKLFTGKVPNDALFTGIQNEIVT